MSKLHSPKGFFPISRYRLFSTILVLVLCVLAINPYTFHAQVAGTAVINWLMVGIMIVALVVMVIDLFITPSPSPASERADAEHATEVAEKAGELRG
jgi:membrane protein YdbS with pleckstrin-like domain